MCAHCVLSAGTCSLYASAEPAKMHIFILVQNQTELINFAARRDTIVQGELLGYRANTGAAKRLHQFT